LESELGRLKNHLVESEEQYTAEAVAWEDKEKGLLGEIADLQRQVAQIVQQRYDFGSQLFRPQVLWLLRLVMLVKAISLLALAFI
jgi:hypothetical protein